MYNRAYGQRRPPHLPENYSGNAFYRVPIEKEEDKKETCQLPEEAPCCEPPCADDPPSEKREETKGGLLPAISGRLFPRGLGGEELLILALILITSQSEGEKDSDLAPLLLLLLFL